MRAVVTGMIATYPVGGVAWDYGQYLLGLEALGYDVYYLEDNGTQTYDPPRRMYGDDCRYAIRFLRDSLSTLSPALADRWHFRSATGESYGVPERSMHDLVADADVFLNVSGGTLLRDEYMTSRCKVLIDSDPGWNHFVNYPRWDANPGWLGTHGYRAHDHFFTYAERIGRSDCLLPTLGLSWNATRPPVMLDRWAPRPPGRKWTTVMTWNNFREPVEYQGRVYGTKEIEFQKIESIPNSHANVEFELAVGGAHPPTSRWQSVGWQVTDSHSVSTTLRDYQNYIETSRGELSVAKNLYVATRSGWFSCRSVCYLAAGRPVVIQETGFSENIPTGEGIFAFSNVEEASGAIAMIEADYPRHQRAARELASEHFDARRILRCLLETIGLA
jgi:hypothetical protein